MTAQTSGTSILLDGVTPLQACDAVAAIIVTHDGRYVMQLRDHRNDIFYPDHWGCFGGAVDSGETPRQALERELFEELELRVDTAVEFMRFDFDFSMLGQSKVFRQYYQIHLGEGDLARCFLHEGVAVEAILSDELLGHRRVTPYDAFAIWIHASASRFRPRSCGDWRQQ